MAGKRQATTDLNHDNWDQEEEPQERGTFRKAPPEELNARPIKQATRRNAIASRSGEDAADTPSKSVFSKFSGFVKPTTASSGSTPFAFLSNISSAPSTGKSPESSLNSKSTNEKTAATLPSAKKLKRETSLSVVSSGHGATPTTNIFGKALVTKGATPSPQPTGTASTEKKESIIGNSSEYRDNVAELNRALMEFLQEHMEANPYCILTPVFDSYNEHARDLLKDLKLKTSSKDGYTPEAAATTSASTSTHGYIFSKPNTTTATDTISAPTTVSFGFGTVMSGGTTTTATNSFFTLTNAQNPLSTPTRSEATSSTASTAEIFSFVKQPPTPATNKLEMPKKGYFFDGASASMAKIPSAPTSNGFSFGLKSDDKHRFGNFNSNGIKMPSVDNSNFVSGNPTEGQDEDCPPEVTFNKVVEEDAVFSIRCKVFVKKNNEFVDRGTGTLYLKPVKDTEKMQMLVRADTNLGNILVNLILSKGLPCQRMGKNNVMMVCIPTPEESKAMSMLVRVKTAENADELFEEIKKHTV